ncbi:MAG: HEAT repeat domain-containing protein [Chloroflexota bacterium]
MSEDEKLQQLVQELEQSLKNPDSSEMRRYRIYKEIFSTNSSQVVEVLCHAMIEEEPELKYHIIRLIGHLGDTRAVEPLLSLYDPNHHTLITDGIVEALGQIGDARAVDMLIEALKSPNPSIYSKSARSLGYIKDERAIEPIIALLKTAHSDRARIYDALRQFKDPNTIEIFIAGLRDPWWNVQVSCANALGEFRKPHTVQPLIEAYNLEYPSAQEATLNALGEIGHPSAISFCTKILHSHSDIGVSISAADALRKIDTEVTHTILRKAMRHSMLEVSQAAALALLFMANEAGMMIVEPLLSHPREEIRQYAIHALSVNGSPKALHLLDKHAITTNVTPPPFSRFGSYPRKDDIDTTWSS